MNWRQINCIIGLILSLNSNSSLIHTAGFCPAESARAYTQINGDYRLLYPDMVALWRVCLLVGLVKTNTKRKDLCSKGESTQSHFMEYFYEVSNLAPSIFVHISTFSSGVMIWCFSLGHYIASALTLFRLESRRRVYWTFKACDATVGVPPLAVDLPWERDAQTVLERGGKFANILQRYKRG